MARTNKTKDALTQSFKELLIKKSFNKITIKDITDRAGYIRPTFYNYFKDKNEVFEYILDKELFDSIYKLFDMDMTVEAISMLFKYFDKNKDFYRRAFEVTGQNSFEEILEKKLEDLVIHALERYKIKDGEKVKFLTNENIASYYARGTELLIESWVTDIRCEDYQVEDLIEAYKYLATHTIMDIFEVDE